MATHATRPSTPCRSRRSARAVPIPRRQPLLLAWFALSSCLLAAGLAPGVPPRRIWGIECRGLSQQMGACESEESMIAFAGGFLAALTVGVFLFVRYRRRQDALAALKHAQQQHASAWEDRYPPALLIASSVIGAPAAFWFAWGRPAGAVGWTLMALSAACAGGVAYVGCRPARRPYTPSPRR